MKKHKIHVDGIDLEIQGDFIAQGISQGVSPYDIAEYESLQIYLEAYRQMYNISLENGIESDVEYYSEQMRETSNSIKDIIRK